MAINQDILNIILRKISTKDINPKTGQPYKVEDIIDPAYKQAAITELTTK